MQCSFDRSALNPVAKTPAWPANGRSWTKPPPAAKTRLSRANAGLQPQQCQNSLRRVALNPAAKTKQKYTAVK